MTLAVLDEFAARKAVDAYERGAVTETELAATQQDLQDLTDLVATLATQADFDALEARVSALETWKGTAEAQITDIYAQLSSLDTRVTALETP